MKKHIYLIGLTHDYQEKPHVLFEKYVFIACKENGIRSIGEEMCRDRLDQVGIPESVIKAIADKFGVPHKYCGPSIKEREDHDISGELLLEAQQFHYGWTVAKFNEEVLIDRKKREAIWLEKIPSVFRDPMLFICGIAHLSTFPSLLRANNYVCAVLERQWDSRKESTYEQAVESSPRH